MQLDQKIISRLDVLIAEGLAILAAKTVRQVEAPIVFATLSSLSRPPQTFSETIVDEERTIQWGLNCRHILGRVFLGDSDQYRQFDSYLQNNRSPEAVGRALAVLRAAKDDIEQGMLFDTRTLIEAEVFSDFMEQAEHLLKAGYKDPAAVIAGAVLEDGLRKLCNRNSIPVPTNATINPLNDALAKAGVYNKLMQKRITELAEIRNNAAHGKWSEFDKDDVADLLKHVQDFMTDHFS